VDLERENPSKPGGEIVGKERIIGKGGIIGRTSWKELKNRVRERSSAKEK
jgi:hypothetical protein